MEDFNIGNIIGPMVAERYNALLDQTMYMVKNFYLLQSELEMAKLKKTKILPGDKYDTFQ